MSDASHTKQDYKNAISSRINDEQLRVNLKSSMDTLKTNRSKLISTRFFDWEDLRERGKKIKQKVLSNLPKYLEDFERNAIKNGATIHWASNSKEANEIIYSLAKQNNVDTILKGKSMASEEIHLNAFLKQKGINAVETDLGELIIQLIDEPPVHIVVPAIHKSRHQINDIFVEKLGSQPVKEPEELNKIARTHMRSKFQGFKMGLSGVNFAIANTGSIWLVENEGNGRMSTTACNLHVAICGIEKIVESFEDASLLNSLLIPSATGAPVTCYNNIISGPRKRYERDSKKDELDGPTQMHIILLDNNRSNMLSQPSYWKALSCIRCGTCLNHCPVYDKIGGHAYLSTYPGPIGEVISPQLFGLNNYSEMTSLCSLCGRCTEKCPVKIPLAELIRDLRSEKVGQGLGKIAGYKEKKKDKSDKMEQFGINIFTSLASSGAKWRSMLFFMDFFGFKDNFLARKFGARIPLLNKWLINHNMPHISSGLHRKVKNLEGVIYE